MIKKCQIRYIYTIISFIQTCTQKVHSHWNFFYTQTTDSHVQRLQRMISASTQFEKIIEKDIYKI